MTREENIAKLAKIKFEAETLVKDYNTAILEERFADARKLDSDIAAKVSEYTATSRLVCFEDCKATENPMLTAVLALTFPTIAAKDEKVDETGDTVVRYIVDAEKPIDLLKLHKHCGSIGADKQWVYMAEKMNFSLTARRANELGVDPKKINDSYAMSAIAKEYDLGKNPASNTNLLKTLQTVVTAMLGKDKDGKEYKATSHDVNYLLAVYSKKGKKALSVSCANHNYFRNYLATICHRIVTGKTYDVEFKAQKNK